MPRLTELFELHAIDPYHRRVDLVDGFGGMEAVVHFLKAHPDERAYVVTDVANTIRAVGFFKGDSLFILTGANDAEIRRLPLEG